MLLALLASPGALLLSLLAWMFREMHRPLTDMDRYCAAVDEELDRLSEEERLIQRMAVVLVCEVEDYLARVHFRGEEAT